MAEDTLKARRVKRVHEHQWLSLEDVVSVGIGKTSDGSIGVVISVKGRFENTRRAVPEHIDGVRIDVIQGETIKAL